jgi:hypothetical protein
MAGPTRPSPAPIDDPVRRCQFCPAAFRAVPLELAIAGRIGTLPDAQVALLTHEADRNR